MNFITVIGASFMITILSTGFIGLIVSSFCYFVKDISVIMPFLFLSLVMFPLFFIAASARLDLSEGGLRRRLKDVLEGWNMISKKRASLFSLILLDIVSVFILSMRYYLAFRVFSFSVPFLYCIILAPLSILSTLIGFTPAGLGVREAVIGFTSKILGTGLNPGIYAASLDRAVVMFWLFILGPIFGYILINAERVPPK
jgi:uncharacterized membrane protein YbhN (UPF0104 family)